RDTGQDACMQAQRLVAPERFELVDVPAPEPEALAEGQVLVRVLAGGVCGSDLPFFRGGISPDVGPDAREFGTPGFPMHEVAGRGPIGLLFAHLAKAAGAAHVTGVDRRDRSDLAAVFGVDQMVQAASDLWVASLPPAGRPELVVEAIGHQTATLTHAIEAVG